MAVAIIISFVQRCKLSQSFLHRQCKECLCNGKLQINLILGKTNIGNIKEACSMLVFFLWRKKPREIPKSRTHFLTCCASRSLPPGRSYSERSMVTTFAYFTSTELSLGIHQRGCYCSHGHLVSGGCSYFGRGILKPGLESKLSTCNVILFPE
jgi:hypothetical protein